jgi:hypothetical protein
VWFYGQHYTFSITETWCVNVMYCHQDCTKLRWSRSVMKAIRKGYGEMKRFKARCSLPMMYLNTSRIEHFQINLIFGSCFTPLIMVLHFDSKYNLKNSWGGSYCWTYNSENCRLRKINVPKRNESLATAMSWYATVFKLAEIFRRFVWTCCLRHQFVVRIVTFC